ncbi:asparagine synthase-related protein [Vibrio hangzhouensis]|uniref:Asparagine synthase (Glutamine-hydrolysing) n=1 Tax=Vibrio hangzhouensis TaxID=462991 RepID=A0A1H5ZXM2_9VIBR|nr:asparagine synthase-related protein [Vibrio hangzhouensis]SEG41253.1 asparagine synthase (glutamine-hydrolysing) [Vibrio hangzhouensis]
MAHYILTVHKKPQINRLQEKDLEQIFDAPVDDHTIIRQDNFSILCWGDPACRDKDRLIIGDVLAGQHKAYWGRSWLALDHLNSTVKANTDVLGLFPVWLKRGGDTIQVATSRQTLYELSQDEKLDDTSMRMLVAFGQLFGECTLWQNIRCLSGRTRLTINAFADIELESTHSPVLYNSQTRFEDALEAFVEAVRIAFSQGTAPLVSLSGGLDSRLILSAAIALGKKPETLTYGHPESGDYQIAHALAQQAGLKLFTGQSSIDPTQYQNIQRVAQLGAGEVPLHHAHSVLDRKLLSLTSGRTLLTGTGAETTRAFYYDRGFPGYSLFGQGVIARDQLMGKARSYIQQEFAKSATPFFEYAPQFKQAMMAELNNRIDEHIDYFSTPAMFLDNFYVQNRVARFVANGQQMLDAHYLRCHPFLNQDALYHMAHLPVRFKLSSTFHRKAIEILAPKLASIRWDKTDKPLSKGLPLSYRYPALASRLGVNRWGKQTAPLFSYASLSDNVSATQLESSLDQMQCHLNIKEEHDLQHIRNHLPTLGYSAVWAHFRKLGAPSSSSRKHAGQESEL